MDEENNRRGGRFALVLAALGIAGAVFSLAAAGSTPAAPETEQVGLAAQAEHAAEAQPAATAAHQVNIVGYAYSPANITVNVGDTVTWTNQDTAPHNVVVTSGPEKFTSPTLQKGQSYTFTFTKAGSYQYYCSVHPDMKASVTVAGTTPTTTTAPPTTGHPTTHPTPTTTAPPTTAPPADCVPKESLAPLLAHIKAAHLETSPLQQVNDALAFDNYVKQHTVLLGQVLDPLLASNVQGEVLEPFIAHVKAAHLETSPLQQVNDALAFDNYVKQHTVLLEQMLTPLLEQATC
ncbi:cupredoxin domain-containing protein [Saccharothrix variisporea]|uniref:Amicyanin n=1 Tax=Saccharothrix variisporea TaxID=543527 RepID=A0A495XJ76_9PSEU|nr:cupredoxin family copper-binding protein [Saccharothrix variisporea]RKT71648.1 amicyanin [Saccharothrix variisporea]